jgi:hypothetical protein
MIAWFALLDKVYDLVAKYSLAKGTFIKNIMIPIFNAD